MGSVAAHVVQGPSHAHDTLWQPPTLNLLRFEQQALSGECLAAGVGRYTIKFSAMRAILLSEPVLQQQLTVTVGRPHHIVGFWRGGVQPPPMPLGKVRKPLLLSLAARHAP